MSLQGVPLSTRRRRVPTEADAAEEWRPIPGFGGRYEASSLGRIRSVGFSAPDRLGKMKPYPARMRKLVPHNAGYLGVGLSRPGQRAQNYLVHRLVASAFLGEPGPAQQVNHKNGDKHDNRVENLEWVDQVANMQHAVETGIFRAARGEASGNAKLTANDVRRIRQLLPRLSPREIADRFGVHQRTIRKIAKGETWTHVQ